MADPRDPKDAYIPADDGTVTTPDLPTDRSPK